MTYKEAIEYINSVQWLGSRPGLSRTYELCRLIGDPQDSLKFIHVAGTNGKGSFCSMMASILTAAGYKVGLYTSPYVSVFNERMRVDGENITDEELAEVTEYVRPYADAMKDKPTEFELITAIAFEFFKRRGCDIVVLEVGMGGRLDSTNIIKTPVLSVITEISLDHTAILGDTIEKIAGEKSGIIKAGVPVIFTGTDSCACDVVRTRASELGCDFYTPDYDSLHINHASVSGAMFSYGGRGGYRIGLAGLYQPRNASAVIAASDVLASVGYAITDESIRAGLSGAVWPARFEVLRKKPVIIYDGGHNPQGVSACFESVGSYFRGKRVTALSGIMADKDHTEAVSIASEHIARMFTVTPSNPRALPAVDYADEYQRNGVDAIPCCSIESGVAMAIADACNEDRPLVIFGSLYMYADIVSVIDTVLPQKAE